MFIRINLPKYCKQCWGLQCELLAQFVVVKPDCNEKPASGYEHGLKRKAGLILPRTAAFNFLKNMPYDGLLSKTRLFSKKFSKF
ncbi:hypothetical protein ASF92_01275 [Pedobacter sp. Leaf176]|nr:hypothetical protein ASF92_01275 [Pedobacter sp. Leaf176]